MTLSPSFQNRLRDSSALLITAAIHIGVAAIALVAVTVSAPPPRPPIETRSIPAPDVPTPPPLPAPPTVEQPIGDPLKAPQIFVEALPPPAAWPDSRPSEPAIAAETLTGSGAATVIAPPADPAPPARGPARTARFDPRHAGDAQPPYPAAARRMGEEGSVIVHVTIGRDGRVRAATIAQSSGSPRLDEAAIAQALKRWRFIPALADGEAIEAVRDITVRFRLAEAEA